MENNKKTRIIKTAISILILLVVLYSGLYYARWRHNNKGRIIYNNRAYHISNTNIDKSEVNKIKEEYPYTKKKSRGYKIYAKDASTPTIIYGENKDHDFISFELLGSP